MPLAWTRELEPATVPGFPASNLEVKARDCGADPAPGGHVFQENVSFEPYFATKKSGGSRDSNSLRKALLLYLVLV